MLNQMSRRDATQGQLKKPIDLDWLNRQDARIIQAVEETANPTQARDRAFQLGLSDRQARNARRLAVLRRDHRDEYSQLMEQYNTAAGTQTEERS